MVKGRRELRAMGRLCVWKGSSVYGLELEGVCADCWNVVKGEL